MKHCFFQGGSLERDPFTTLLDSLCRSIEEGTQGEADSRDKKALLLQQARTSRQASGSHWREGQQRAWGEVQWEQVRESRIRWLVPAFSFQWKHGPAQVMARLLISLGMWPLPLLLPVWCSSECQGNASPA